MVTQPVRNGIVAVTTRIRRILFMITAIGMSRRFIQWRGKMDDPKDDCNSRTYQVVSERMDGRIRAVTKD